MPYNLSGSRVIHQFMNGITATVSYEQCTQRFIDFFRRLLMTNFNWLDFTNSKLPLHGNFKFRSYNSARLKCTCFINFEQKILYSISIAMKNLFWQGLWLFKANTGTSMSLSIEHRVFFLRLRCDVFQ